MSHRTCRKRSVHHETTMTLCASEKCRPVSSRSFANYLRFLNGTRLTRHLSGAPATHDHSFLEETLSQNENCVVFIFRAV
jgi:hypothetical protein